MTMMKTFGSLVSSKRTVLILRVIINLPPVAPEPIPRNEIKCKCGKPVLIRVAGPNSKPENVGKEYATCKTNSCNYWALVEFAHIKCRCGNPARICITKNGMDHNIGREFGVCAEKKCGFWMWADGGRPFGQKSQELFNEHMDAWVNSID